MIIIFKVDSEHFIVDFFYDWQTAEQNQDNHYEFVEKHIDFEPETYLNKDIRDV